MTTIDLYLSGVPEVGWVYGLVASDEPMQVRYVGKTIAPLWLRLKGHVGARTGGQSARRIRDWSAEVKARGAEVGIRMLGEYPLALLGQAECRWMAFWSRYCDLFNRWRPHNAMGRLPHNPPRIRSVTPGKG